MMRPSPHIAAVRELDPPGDMTGSKVYPFEFSRVDLLYESYNGINVRLRYLLRVTVTRMYANTCTRDFPLWVRNTHTVPAINNSIKMEVSLPPSPPHPPRATVPSTLFLDAYCGTGAALAHPNMSVRQACH
jgi:hypothetical protein